MRKIENLDAAKALVKLYRSITLKKLQKAQDELHKEYSKKYSYRRITGSAILGRITGFGSQYTCTLCKDVYKYQCKGCIYIAGGDNYMACLHGDNRKTYMAIGGTDLVELRKAIRARATYLNKLIKKVDDKGYMHD